MFKKAFTVIYYFNFVYRSKRKMYHDECVGEHAEGSRQYLALSHRHTLTHQLFDAPVVLNQQMRPQMHKCRDEREYDSGQNKEEEKYTKQKKSEGIYEE